MATAAEAIREKDLTLHVDWTPYRISRCQMPSVTGTYAHSFAALTSKLGGPALLYCRNCGLTIEARVMEPTDG